jgi:hypothetical protein
VGRSRTLPEPAAALTAVKNPPVAAAGRRILPPGRGTGPGIAQWGIVLRLPKMEGPAMKRAIPLIAALVVIGLCVRAAPTAPPEPQQTKVQKTMVEKLKSSQSLLAGIATADFTKITLSTEELIRLSRTEEWQVIKTPRYELHSNEFRRAAEVILQKAKAKNIDGVTLSYFELTMSCVRCHSYVREVREARAPAPRPLEVAVHPVP